MEATIKSQERLNKKTFKQHCARHFKDILSVRRNDAQHSSRGSRTQSQANTRLVT